MATNLTPRSKPTTDITKRTKPEPTEQADLLTEDGDFLLLENESHIITIEESDGTQLIPRVKP